MKRIIYGLSGFIIFAFNYPALAEIPVKKGSAPFYLHHFLKAEYFNHESEVQREHTSH